jgi:hypothetical protein
VNLKSWAVEAWKAPPAQPHPRNSWPDSPHLGVSSRTNRELLNLAPPFGYPQPPWKRGIGEVESRASTSEQDTVGTPPNFAPGSRCMPGACQSYVVKLLCRACSYSSVAKRSNARSITTFNDPIPLTGNIDFFFGSGGHSA